MQKRRPEGRRFERDDRSSRLVGCGGGDVDPAAVAVEEDIAFHEGEDGVVFADADVFAGVPLGATLAEDDVAGDDDFAAKLFHAEAFAA